MIEPYYENEHGKLYCGDCLAVMQELIAEGVKVDSVVTDPPYGIDFQSAWRTETKRFVKISNDKTPMVSWVKPVKDLLNIIACVICFCRWDVQEEFRQALESKPLTVKSQIIWDRVVHGLGDLSGAFAPQHDVIWFATKGKYAFPSDRPKSVMRCQRVDADKLVHPNEKPLSLMKQIITAVVPTGGMLMDPFCGSGSTIAAAQSLGRKWIGIEISPEYCAICVKRLEGTIRQIDGQQTLFDTDFMRQPRIDEPVPDACEQIEMEELL